MTAEMIRMIKMKKGMKQDKTEIVIEEKTQDKVEVELPEEAETREVVDIDKILNNNQNGIK